MKGTIRNRIDLSEIIVVHVFSVHIRAEEKLNVVMTRDGRVESFDVSGILQLHVTDPKLNTVKMQIANQDQRGAQLQVYTCFRFFTFI